MRHASLILAVLGAVGAVQAGETNGPANLPTNKWVKLEAVDKTQGYEHSQLVYVPTRGQFLHWGATWRNSGNMGVRRDDVRAFDPEKADWVSDYPVSPRQASIRFGSSGNKGVSALGYGEMLPSGIPAPALIVNGVAYDSKRDRLIYSMNRLTVAYGPKTKKWTDLKAKTILGDKEYPGAPPCFAMGTCYDPVNDEILLFPHYPGNAYIGDGEGWQRDPKYADYPRAKVDPLLAATGRSRSHLGTFVYRCEDNTWRQLGEADLADKEVVEARAKLAGLLKRLSDALDELWAARGLPEEKRPAALVRVASKLSELAADVGKTGLPAEAQKLLAEAGPLLAKAGEEAKAGRLTEALGGPGAAALRAMENVGETALCIEPPPRCNTALVYDEKNKCIVMFGGTDGVVRTDLDGKQSWPAGRNDTWIWDVAKRRWRELSCKTRPPLTNNGALVYDPKSGLVLYLYPGVGLWALDVAKAEWTRRLETGIPRGPVERFSGTAAFDPRRRLLLWAQNVEVSGKMEQETYALRLDLDALPAMGAKPEAPVPAYQPIVIPPDDPAWVEKLKNLPANQWTGTGCPRETQNRDWGGVTVDAINGWVIFWGGGHATYQINNPDVYAVGANKWVTGIGEDNNLVPSIGPWSGYTGGLITGGPSIVHTSYAACDGRMIAGAGFNGPQGSIQFYDLWRGGSWRTVPLTAVTADEGTLDDIWEAYGSMSRKGESRGSCRLTAVDVGGTGHAYVLRGFYYSDRKLGGNRYLWDYDSYANSLTVRSTPGPYPGSVGECTPACHLADRGQVLFFEFESQDKDKRTRTWLYDAKEKKWTDLKPKNQPDSWPLKLEYVPEQKVVYATVDGYNPRQWVYSLERNVWAPMEWQGARHGKAGPYGQFVYVKKYGVFVAVGTTGGGTKVMRPDFSQIKWE